MNFSSADPEFPFSPGEEEARRSEIAQSLTHFDEAVCLRAIAGVMRTRPNDAVELLLLAARKGRPLVCVSALTSIGELGDLGQVSLLREELNSDRSFRRIGAARGLAALAVRCPEGDFTSAMEALQKKARLGEVEYRGALETIRRAIGIDPELPIPAIGGELRPEALPIPAERQEAVRFVPEGSSPLSAALLGHEEEGDSLSRRLKGTLPPPSTWEYD